MTERKGAGLTDEDIAALRYEAIVGHPPIKPIDPKEICTISDLLSHRAAFAEGQRQLWAALIDIESDDDIIKEHPEIRETLRHMVEAHERAAREEGASRQRQAIERSTPSGAAFFLNWLADRLTCVYKESENTDFVQATRRIAAAIEHAGVEAAHDDPFPNLTPELIEHGKALGENLLNSAATSGESAEQCGTCGSDDPARRELAGGIVNINDHACRDEFHDSAERGGKRHRHGVNVCYAAVCEKDAQKEEEPEDA